jgi:hypothetical protein
MIPTPLHMDQAEQESARYTQEIQFELRRRRNPFRKQLPDSDTDNGISRLVCNSYLLVVLPFENDTTGTWRTTLCHSLDWHVIACFDFITACVVW